MAALSWGKCCRRTSRRVRCRNPPRLLFGQAARRNPSRHARSGIQDAVAKESVNTSEVGEDIYVPLDEQKEDMSLHSDASSIEEASDESEMSTEQPEGEDGSEAGSSTQGEEEPEEDILGPLPEEQAAMQAAATQGDEEAALKLARWEELRLKGKLATYGTAAESPPSSYQDDDATYHVRDEADEEAAESSRMAEERAVALVDEPPSRQLLVELLVEPDDDDEGLEEEEEEGVGRQKLEDEARRKKLLEWPVLTDRVPVEEWHPSRFVFDEKDRLVLPPQDVAHKMYGFLTTARTEVSQFQLSDPRVSKFLAKAESGKRQSLNFKELGEKYHLWDPRLQNLLSQVETTDAGIDVSKRRKTWRDYLEYRGLEIKLKEVHQQAERLGIKRPHLQRPVQPSHRWPDPLPVVLDNDLLALPAPPAQGQAPFTGSPSNGPYPTAECDLPQQEHERASEAQVGAGELAAAKRLIEQLTQELQDRASEAEVAASELAAAQAAIGQLNQQLQDRAVAGQLAADQLAAAHATIQELNRQLEDRAAAGQGGTGEAMQQTPTVAELTQQLHTMQGAATAKDDSLRELRTRHSRLNQAYSDGKDEYLRTRDEMERRDALHNALVVSCQELTDEKSRLVHKADRLGKRVVNIQQQRDELQANLGTSDARHKLAEMRKERDDLKIFCSGRKETNVKLLEQLKQAEKTIKKLLKQLNQK